MNISVGMTSRFFCSSILLLDTSKFRHLFAVLLLATVVTMPLQAAPGDIDTAFGAQGLIITNVTSIPDGVLSAYALDIDDNGRLVVAGDAVLTRYLPDGRPDTSFASALTGDRGAIILPEGVTAQDVMIDSQGRYVVAGTRNDSDLFLARYTSSGEFDATFGTNGRVVPDFGGKEYGYSVIELSGGGYLVAGIYGVISGRSGSYAYSLLLARFTADGVLDTSFGNSGTVITSSVINVYSLIEVSGGGYLVAGSNGSDFTLARYTTTGALDTAFGTGGLVTTDLGGTDSAYSVIEVSDGGVVVAGSNGSDFALARYTTTGALDTAFGTGGLVTTDLGGTDSAYSVIEASGGGFVVAGSNGSDFALARYSALGALDTSFGTGGLVTTDLSGTDTAYSIVETGGEFVVAGGNGNDFVLARYTSAGALDVSFDTDGMVHTDFRGSEDQAYSVIETSDGKFLVAGSAGADYALTRYDASGALDATFGTGGRVVMATIHYADAFYSVIETSDGGYLAVGGLADSGIPTSSGTADFILARFTSAGALDTTFGVNGVVRTGFSYSGYPSSDYARSAIQMSDGSYLVAGFGGITTSTPSAIILARYDANGNLVTSFGTGGSVLTEVGFGYVNEIVSTVIETSSGDILVAGKDANTSYSSMVARYTATGGFVRASYVNGAVLSVGTYSNHRIYDLVEGDNGSYWAVGYSSDSSGTIPPNVVTLSRFINSDVPDTSFGSGGHAAVDFPGTVVEARSITKDSGGNLLIGGNSDSDFALARYTATGTLDTSFGSNGVAVTDIYGLPATSYSLIETSAGDYVMAGSLSSHTSTITVSEKDFGLAKYLGNTPPALGGVIAGQAVNDNNTHTPFAAVTVVDDDNDNVSVSVTLDSDTKGGFTTASLTTSGFVAAGGGVYTLASTTTAAAQAALRALDFDPADNRVAPGATETTTFTLAVSDGRRTTTNNATTVVATSINDAPVFTGTPSISGTALVGSTLSATSTATSDPDTGDGVGLTYQWKADSVAIGGATAATYDLTNAEAHKTLTMTITASDNFGGSVVVTTAGVAVDNAIPVNNVAPAISGVAEVGQTLTASTGTWTDVDGDNLTYHYQWQADSSNIGSDSNTLVLSSAERNKIITVTVTANDGNGGVASSTSNSVNVGNVAPVNSVAPVISGTAVVGQALTASTGTWTDDDGDNLTYAYQWKADGVNVGTNSANLTLSITDAHKSITVAVTANDSNGGVVTVTSASVTVANSAPVNSVLPLISGILMENQTLLTTSGNWSDADGDVVSYTYQWKSGGTVVGTNQNSYTLMAGDVGNTLTVTVTANDGQGGVVIANSVATTVVDGDMDGDGIGDAVDPDIDGDGMSNAYEDANGLNKWDASDRNTDLDGDGVSNYNESIANSNANVDDYPPVFTSVPGTVSVNATGLFTAVTLGLPTAEDALDGVVTPTVTQIVSNNLTRTLNGTPTHLSPGVHVVTWTAADAAGNSVTATQTVNVTPLVELNKDQITSEGTVATFKVILNGPAVNYPVTVPYTVSGTALTDGSDHDLIDGEVTIDSGLSKIVNVSIVDDGAGEGSETMVVTLGTPINAVVGPKSIHTMTILEGNAAPTVSLSANQGSGAIRIVEQGSADVVVTAAVVDPNPGDTHSYDWSATDNALSDIDGNVVDGGFTFTPSTVGIFTLRVTVTDSGSGALSDRAELNINVIAALVPLTPGTDTDGDGINDDDPSERFGDDDGDGVPNYRDHSGMQRNTLQEKSDTADSFVIESEPGIKLALGQVAFKANASKAGVTESDITNYGNSTGAALDERYSYPGGLFDFAAEELPVAGQSVDIVIPQLVAIPANAVYRKLMPAGWQDFVEDANNSVASALGSEGFCPPSGDSSYTAGLTEGHWCIQLTIEDGGPNDADGTADSTVTDPGGVAQLSTGRVNVSGSGGGAMNLWWLALLAAGGMLVRRRRLLPITLALCLSSGLMVATQPAYAWYAGGSLGQVMGDESMGDLNAQLADAGANATASNLDADRTGWKLFVGVPMDEKTNFELSYIDLGEINVELSGSIVDIDAFLNTVSTIHPSTADGVSYSFTHRLYQHPQFAVHGRVGVFFWQAEYDLVGQTASKTVKANGNDITYGLMVDHAIDDRLTLRFEAEHYEVDKETMDFFNLGLGYRFD